MLFQQAKKHAQAAQDRAKAAQDQVKAAKKVALEAEKDNDAAQKKLQELQRVMEPKRARTNATTANDRPLSLPWKIEQRRLGQQRGMLCLARRHWLPLQPQAQRALVVRQTALWLPPLALQLHPLL